MTKDSKLLNIIDDIADFFDDHPNAMLFNIESNQAGAQSCLEPLAELSIALMNQKLISKQKVLEKNLKVLIRKKNHTRDEELKMLDRIELFGKDLDKFNAKLHYLIDSISDDYSSDFEDRSEDY